MGVPVVPVVKVPLDPLDVQVVSLWIDLNPRSSQVLPTGAREYSTENCIRFSWRDTIYS